MKLEIESNFEVGQVVFFIASKTESVIPALVAEKIVRTRIDGAQIAYVLHIKTAKGLKEHEVNPDKTKLYASLEEVRTTMMSSADRAISQLIATASAAAAELGRGHKRK